jgi:hypothetical protein
MDDIVADGHKRNGRIGNYILKKHSEMEQLIKAQEVVNGGYLRAAPTSIRFDSTQLSPMIIQVAILKHVIPTIGETLYTIHW